MAPLRYQVDQADDAARRHELAKPLPHHKTKRLLIF